MAFFRSGGDSRSSLGSTHQSQLSDVELARLDFRTSQREALHLIDDIIIALSPGTLNRRARRDFRRRIHEAPDHGPLNEMLRALNPRLFGEVGRPSGGGRAGRAGTTAPGWLISRRTAQYSSSSPPSTGSWSAI